MELVDDKKIEAICEFIGNGHESHFQYRDS